MAISFAGLSGGGGKVQKVDYIKSTQTWTAPDDVSTVSVTLVGGGGGGFGYHNSNGDPYNLGGGGGGGGVLKKTLEVTPGATYTITIGAGGSARNSNSYSSSFPSSASANALYIYGNPGSSTKFGNLAEAGGGMGPISVVNADELEDVPWYDSDTIYGSAGGNIALPANGSNKWYIGAAGGGAGGAAPNVFTKMTGFRTTGNTEFLAPTIPGANFWLGNNQGNPGNVSNTADQFNSFADSRWSIAGPGGLGTGEGFGAGGTGGTTSYPGSPAASIAATKSSGNGGSGAVADNSPDAVNANAGALNTGSGGGGGAKDVSLKKDGGNGGSGVAIIEYITGEA